MKKALLLLFIGTISFISVHAQLTESFDGTIFPPAGWTNAHTTGDDATALWEKALAGAFGGDSIANNANSAFSVDPHSGAGMASFRSYEFESGNGANLITSAVNLSTAGPHIISFWMYRDNIYTVADSISVFVNTTQSVIGASFLGRVYRKRALPPAETRPNGWFQYTFAIPANFNTTTNYFIFSAGGDYGNNIFIDDISVTPQAACGTPTALAVSDLNLAGGSITVNWSVPSVGSPTGYEWAINTTGALPSTSGIAATGTTANITGVTAGQLNYIYLRSGCTGGSFSTWSYVGIAALPCATLTAPVNAATGVSQNPSFSWNAVTGATSYDFYIGPASASEIYLGSTTNTTESISNFLPLQTYYWHVVPTRNGVAAPSDACTADSFTVVVEATTPPNNPCSGAVTITAANITGNAINATTLGATITLNPPGDCSGFEPGTPDDDVWFEFTTSATAPAGTLTIAPAVTGGIFDIVAQIYAATSCTTLGSLVTCTDATIDEETEVVNLALLSPNTHYFMRVYSWSEDSFDQGAFTIVASAGNTLPVTMSTFMARRSNGVNVLNWSTQTESNTSHFVIERSNDGRNFAGIGKVTANGTTNEVRNYTFTDMHPATGNNYYRIRTVDRDNLAKLSVIRSIRNLGIANVSLYPNPVTDKLSLNIDADKASTGHLLITDMGGKTVYASPVRLPQGNTILPVPVNNIAAGSYIIKIQLNEDVIVKKFSKQ